MGKKPYLASTSPIKKAHKPPEMQLEAFTLILAFQAGRSGTKLVSQGHLQARQQNGKLEKETFNFKRKRVAQ